MPLVLFWSSNFWPVTKVEYGQLSVDWLTYPWKLVCNRMFCFQLDMANLGLYAFAKPHIFFSMFGTTSDSTRGGGAGLEDLFLPNLHLFEPREHRSANGRPHHEPSLVWRGALLGVWCSNIGKTWQNIVLYTPVRRNFWITEMVRLCKQMIFFYWEWMYIPHF